MNRVEKIRKFMDDLLEAQQDYEVRRCGYVHLYGVSLFAVMLAEKRGLDRELASVVGMMHDIKSFRTGDASDHAVLGAREAEQILMGFEEFSPGEREIICRAISEHSRKTETDGEYSELIKDADVLHHYLYNPVFGVPVKEEPRLRRLLHEIGCREE